MPHCILYVSFETNSKQTDRAAPRWLCLASVVHGFLTSMRVLLAFSVTFGITENALYLWNHNNSVPCRGDNNSKRIQFNDTCCVVPGSWNRKECCLALAFGVSSHLVRLASPALVCCPVVPPGEKPTYQLYISRVHLISSRVMRCPNRAR